jgi:hypothetical protein
VAADEYFDKLYVVHTVVVVDVERDNITNILDIVTRQGCQMAEYKQ